MGIFKLRDSALLAGTAPSNCPEKLWGEKLPNLEGKSLSNMVGVSKPSCIARPYKSGFKILPELLVAWIQLTAPLNSAS